MSWMVNVTMSSWRAASLAVVTAYRPPHAHHGPPADVDHAYGILATYVSRHALAVQGPIREYYVVSQRDTPDASQWVTEIGCKYSEVV